MLCIHKTNAIIPNDLFTFICCFGRGKTKQLIHISLLALILKITQQAEVSWSFTSMCHVQALLLIFHLRWQPSGLPTWLGDWWWANRLPGHFTQPNREEIQANCLLADLEKRISAYLSLILLRWHRRVAEGDGHSPPAGCVPTVTGTLWRGWN